jgi:hypothetical protein
VKENPMKPTKPKKNAKRRAAPEEAVTSSGKPELENDDTEVVPPFAGTAEAEQEKAEAQADDDGMPGEDAPGPDAGGVKRRARL